MNRRGQRFTASNLGTLVLWSAAFLLVLIPAAQVFRKLWAMDRPVAPADRIDILSPAAALAAGQTLLWCSLIALVATALALIWAWWMRGLGPRARIWAFGVGLTPLLLPSYLAYAAWNLLRAPGSWLGDTLAVAPPWASVWAGRAMAIGGLALWVWPLALLILAPAAARLSQSTLDAMRADGAPLSVRATQTLWLLAGDILRAILLCALIMAGSAIPLHVAQVNTYTIWLWSELNRVPDIRGIWLASWPVLILAFIGSAFIFRLLPTAQRNPAEPDPREPQPLRRPGTASLMLTAAACCVWAVSVLVPVLMFALSVREPSAFPGFWREAGDGVISGLHVGAWVGAIGALILLCTWVAIANTPSRRQLNIGPPVLWLAFAGLIPGVLIGSAFSQDALFQGVPLIVAAHLARFVFIAALIGWWLGTSEPSDLRNLRELDNAATLRGWLAACVRPRQGVILGAAIALALLSLHEIESTVQVQPPGLANLAQYLLDQLHYLREDQLAAAGATMTGIGLLGAIVGGVLLAKSAAADSERS